MIGDLPIVTEPESAFDVDQDACHPICHRLVQIDLPVGLWDIRSNWGAILNVVEVTLIQPDKPRVAAFESPPDGTFIRLARKVAATLAGSAFHQTQVKHAFQAAADTKSNRATRAQSAILRGLRRNGRFGQTSGKHSSKAAAELQRAKK